MAPLAAALFLLMGGGLFLFILPPVGVVLVLLCLVAVAWAVVQQVIARVVPHRERVEEGGADGAPKPVAERSEQKPTQPDFEI